MRRRLVKDARFGIPDGPEEHYRDIRARGGKIRGKVEAPLFHSYTYYMPENSDVSEEQWTNFDNQPSYFWDVFKAQMLELAKITALVGPSHAAACFIGMYVFAESESLFAYYIAKAVTFGSSHVDFFIHGYCLGLVSTPKTSKFTACLLTWLNGPDVANEVWHWADAGFALFRSGPYLHRIDNLSHIGGLIAGFFWARYVSRNVSKGTWDAFDVLF